MKGRGGKGAILCGLLLASVALPGRAAAASDGYLRGSLVVAGVADDNLFSTPAPAERDLITRTTPGIEAGRVSARYSFATRYTRDLESFADHPDLDTNRARQNATLDLTTHPGRLVDLSFHASWLTTTTPGELNLGTALAAGRRGARRLVLNPTLAGRLGGTTSWSAGFTQSLDGLSGGVAADTRVADLGLEQQATPRSLVRVGYAFSRFDFDPGGLATAHTLTLGWNHELGPRSSLELRGGPRFSEGSVDPEISLALRRRFRRGSLSVAYGQSLATVIGQAGTVTTRSLTPAFSWQPWRFLELSAMPALYRIRSTSDGAETEVRFLDVQARGRLGRWLSLVATYQHSLQAGDPGAPPGGAGAEIEHNTFLLSLVARPPDRPRPARGETEGATP